MSCCPGTGRTHSHLSSVPEPQMGAPAPATDAPWAPQTPPVRNRMHVPPTSYWFPPEVLHSWGHPFPFCKPENPLSLKPNQSHTKSCYFIWKVFFKSLPVVSCHRMKCYLTSLGPPRPHSRPFSSTVCASLQPLLNTTGCRNHHAVSWL